jgi:TP901 family phage tail tape measure protein
LAINAGTVTAFLELNTSKFGRGLDIARNQLKEAGRDFSKAFDTASSASISSRLSNIGSGFKNLGSSVSSVGQSITTNVSKPLAVAGGAAIKMAMDFETGMAKIKTIADTSQVPLSKLANDIKKISSETGQEIGDVQNAVYEALSSGVSTDKVSDFTMVASKAAIGGFTDTQTAVDGLTTTMNSFGQTADKANSIANQMMVAQNLGKTTFGEMSSSIGNVAASASAAGMKTNELFSSLAVLTANGIQTSESITGIKAALSNVITPLDKANEAAAALGLNFNAAEIKSKGWMGFLQEVRDKLESSAPAYAAATDKVNELEAKIKAAQEGKKETAEQYKAEIQAENDAIDELEKQKDKAANSVEKKQIEAEIEVHKEKIKTLKKEAEQAKESYSPEQIQQWKQELKEAKKQQETLEKTSGDKLSGFATMFSSIEGLNSVLALTSNNGTKLYKESMEQMASGTDYLTQAYDIMMDTPEYKMKKAIASLKVAAIDIGSIFLPFVSRIAEGVASLAQAFDKLPKSVQAITGYSLALVAAGGPMINIIGKIISSWGSFFTLLSKIPKGISKVTGAFKKIGPEISKPGSAIKNANKSLNIDDAVNKASGSLKKMEKASSKAVTPILELGKAAKNSTKGIREINSSSGNTTKALSKLSKEGSSASKALAKLNSSGSKAAKTLSRIDKEASAAAKSLALTNMAARDAAWELNRVNKEGNNAAKGISKTGKSAGGIKGAFSKLGQSIKNVPSLFSKTGSSASKLGNNFSKVNKETGKTAGAFSKIRSLGSKIPNVFTRIGSTGGKLPNVFSRVGTALGKLPGAFSKVASALSKTSILSSFTKLAGGAGKVGKAFNAIKTIAGVVFTVLPGIINPPVLIAVGVIAGLGLIVYEVMKHWEGFRKKIKGIWEGIKNVFSNISFADIGKSIVDGLVKGFENAFPNVTKVVKTLAQGIKNIFKDDLEIHSPSKVFERFGINTGEGYLGGLKLMENPIVKQIGNYGQLVTSKMKSLVGTKNPSILAIGNSKLRTGAIEKLRNSMLNFNPKITIYVTVADTGEKGIAKLTKEIDTMARKSLKNGLIDMFTDDAVRN